jgi:hypothetical protein
VKFSPPKGMEGWEKLRHKPSLAYGKYGFSARSAIKEAQAKQHENLKSILLHLSPFRRSKKNKALPEYDEEASTVMIVFTWYGTMFPLVLRKPLFWMMIFFHLILLGIDGGWFYGWRPWDVDESIDYALLSMPINLLVFFAVFYGSQCYGRFFDFYSNCVGIGARTMEWVGLVTMHIPRDSTLHWNCCRFILAAAHVQYYEVNSADSIHNSVDSEEWKVIVARKLLSVEEAAGMQQYAGYGPWLLITWALQEVKVALLRTPENDRGRSQYELVKTYERFELVAMNLRSHMGTIWNMLKQPVPFAYFHLLVLLNSAVLGMLAYGMVGMGDWFVTLAIYTLATLALMGLRELAVAMADPFGDDTIDFKLEKFLEASFKNTLALLAVERDVCSYTPLVASPVDYALD